MSGFNCNFKYEQICRTCLKNEEDVISLQSIFDNTITSIEITDELSRMDLKLCKDDGFPQSICNECVDGLMYLYTFRKLCENSQITLERFHISNKIVDLEFVDVDLLNNVKVEPETDQKLEIQLGNVILPDNDVEISNDKRIQNEMVEFGSHSDEIRIKRRVYHTCFRCGQFCRNGEELICHEKNNCVAKSIPKHRNCNEIFETVELLDVHPIKNQNKVCPVCGKCFNTSHDCKVHIESHSEAHPYKCDMCDSKYKCRSYLNRHKRIKHTFGDHECPHCSKKFKNTNKYQYHLKTHNPNKKYKCQYCDKSFLLRHHYENHERVHSGIRPYLCNICGKCFRLMDSLTLHLRMHNGVRPFVCTTCGKKFAESRALLLHKKKHAGIFPYCCDSCGKKFSHKSALNVHLRSHTGERPFKCDLCDKSYTTNVSLKLHKAKVHDLVLIKSEYQYGNKLKCSVCLREFKFPSALAIHIKTHSEERKFDCSECDKSFKRAEHLRIHVSGVHLKQKPYACGICDKSFSQSGDRNKHRLLHKEEKPHSALL